MWSYILRRLCFGIPTLLGVTIIVFTLLHLAPGDPISAMVPSDAPLEVVQMIRQQMGLDKPLPVQYWRWLTRVAHGDLGNSLATRRPVLNEIRAALGNTFLLAVSAACIGFTLGVMLGTTAAFFQGRWVDKVASAVAITGVSLPHYWVGIMLIIVFSVTLNWLPAMGMQETSGGSSLWTLLRHMLLPSIALALIPMGVITRMVRASVLEILQQDFVLTLRAKGLWSRTVTRHVMKNAAPPVLTLMGLQFGYLLGGSVLVETVFSWPGSGFLLNLAIFQRDIPMLQGVILVLATFFVILNLLVDILHSLIDPRIRRTCRGMLMAEPALIHPPQELLEGPAGTPMPYWKLVWWRLRRDKVTLAAAAVILCIVLSAVLAPSLAPHNPAQGSIRKRLAPLGTPGYILGTDEQGRDMLSRLLYGGRLSLTAGVVPVCIALLAGATLGILAGFMGRGVNMLIMRTMDIFYAFPSVLLAIAISGALGAGVGNTIIALSIVFTPPITRVAESVTTQVRGWEFMEAARASGAGTVMIICHHMIANVVAPIFVYASTLVSVSIILASGLSFLGLGASPPNAEWGLMLNTLRQSIYVNTWVPVLPGVMIFVTSMAFNLLSDGLRDAMDVRL